MIFFGLLLFGESYLYAFTYLLSPGFVGPRPLRYPNTRRRTSHLSSAAKEFNIDLLPDFSSDFVDGKEHVDPAINLLVSIADEVSASLVPNLLVKVKEVFENKNIPIRNQDRVTHIRKEFEKWVCPTTRQESLVDILNAGWKCDQDSNLWENVPQIKPENKKPVLRDLIYKSMEIAEIHERWSQPS